MRAWRITVKMASTGSKTESNVLEWYTEAYAAERRRDYRASLAMREARGRHLAAADSAGKAVDRPLIQFVGVDRAFYKSIEADISAGRRAFVFDDRNGPLVADEVVRRADGKLIEATSEREVVDLQTMVTSSHVPRPGTTDGEEASAASDTMRLRAVTPLGARELMKAFLAAVIAVGNQRA